MSDSDTKINQYIITKLLNNGDYLARDQSNKQYLFIPITQHITKKTDSAIDIQSQLIKPQQTIKINSEKNQSGNQTYQCFPIPLKSLWIGQLSAIKLKSQLYCISLLYNAVNQIVKPLIQKYKSSSLQYLCLNNFWIRNHQVFLFLNAREPLMTLPMEQLQKKCLKRLAEILYKVIYKHNPNDPQQKCLLFISMLLKNMYKQSISILSFDLIMNHKDQRLKFQNQQRSHLNLNVIQSKNNRRFLLQKPKKQRWSSLQNKIEIIKEKKKKKIQIIPPSFQKNIRRSFDLTALYSKSQDVKRKKMESLSITHDFQTPISKTRLKGNTQNIQKTYSRTSGSFRINYLIDQNKDKALNKFYEKNKQLSLDSKNLKSIIMSKTNTTNFYQETKKEVSHSYNTIDCQRSFNNHNPNPVKETIHYEENQSNKIPYKPQQTNIIQKNVQPLLKIIDKPVQQNIRNVEIAKNENDKKEYKFQRNQFVKKLSQNKSKPQFNIKKFDSPPQDDFQYANIVEIGLNQRKTKLEKQIQVVKNIFQNKHQVKQEVKEEPKPQIKHQLKKIPLDNYQDEIQQIKLIDKNQVIKNQKQTLQKQTLQKQNKKEANTKIQQKKQAQRKTEIQKKFPPSYPKSANLEQQYYEKKQKINKDVQQNKRMHSKQSSVASSFGPQKPIRRQIEQYIIFINKMGQAVAKSSKISKKLDDIEWYTGIYFIYKRFFYERKRIEEWIEKGIPKLSRYTITNMNQWNQWLGKEDRQQTLRKIKQDNLNIEQSIKKMNKRVMKKNLPGKTLFHCNLDRQSFEQSKITVELVVDEYDQLVEKDKLVDEELWIHISDIINCLYVISQLDGKTTNKKTIQQLSSRITRQKLQDAADYFYDLYEI